MTKRERDRWICRAHANTQSRYAAIVERFGWQQQRKVLEQYPRARWPNANACNQWTLVEIFLRGEHLTVATALEKYRVYALSQECGRLRQLGWPIQSEFVKLPSGKAIKEYWLKGNHDLP